MITLKITKPTPQLTYELTQIPSAVQEIAQDLRYETASSLLIRFSSKKMYSLNLAGRLNPDLM